MKFIFLNISTFFDCYSINKFLSAKIFKLVIILVVMSDMLLEVRIEDLLLIQREVQKKKVGRYIMRYKRGMDVEPVIVTYCVCTGKYELSDGHHRVVAAHLVGKSSVRAKIEPCYLFDCEGMDCDPYWNYWNIRHKILE